MSKKELIEKAKEARLKAYAPISNYLIGAALLTKSGKVYLGANIEDKNYIGINSCAERTAVNKAIIDGEFEYDSIAVVCGKEKLEKGTPCGVCRQYLSGFNKDMKILVADSESYDEYTIDELLPHSFEL